MQKKATKHIIRQEKEQTNYARGKAYKKILIHNL